MCTILIFTLIYLDERNKTNQNICVLLISIIISYKKGKAGKRNINKHKKAFHFYDSSSSSSAPFIHFHHILNIARLSQTFIYSATLLLASQFSCMIYVLTESFSKLILLLMSSFYDRSGEGRNINENDAVSST